MDINNLNGLLGDYKAGKISLEETVNKLKILPFEDLGFVKIDHHRRLRQGFPEVVFCQGKTVEQVVTIVEHLSLNNPNILATRASREMYNAVKMVITDAKYHESARIIQVEREQPSPETDKFILVMTAGTSDIPVAEEAAITAEAMGNKVERLYDVGVAGIHRLFASQEIIYKAHVIIVVAGMEGALASVVGGMVDKPVVAVPTSVGYGANFGGLSALLSMLNSCAAGVGVVNIDNGFGAGRLASIINQLH